MRRIITLLLLCLPSLALGQTVSLPPWATGTLNNIQISIPPSSLGNWNSVTTAFSGDLSAVQFPVEHRIIGTTTLTQPSSGYVFTPEASAYAQFFYNSSGWNQDLGDNNGRTAATFDYSALAQTGQGDAMMHFCNLTTSGVKASATSFLANSASACIAVDHFAGANGVYLQAFGDIDFNDNGFDVAAIGIGAVNLKRTADTEGLGAFWTGTRFQSVGSKPIDAYETWIGPATKGIDMTGGTFSSFQLETISFTNGGSNFAQNDTITLSGGTCDVEPEMIVDTVSSGVITAMHVLLSGICSAAPSTTPTWTTSGSGTSATFSAAYGQNAAIVMAPGSGIYMHAANATSTKFPNSTTLGVDGTILSYTGGMAIGRGGSILGSAGQNEISIGHSNQNLATDSITTGIQSYDKARGNTFAFSSGQFSSVGDNQVVTQIIRVTTSSTSTTAAHTNGSASGSSTNAVNILTHTAQPVAIWCVARDTTNDDSATWDQAYGTLNRVAGNASYAGAYSGATNTPTRSTGAGSTANIQVTADTSNQGLNVGWTAPNTDAWRFMCLITDMEI